MRTKPLTTKQPLTTTKKADAEDADRRLAAHADEGPAFATLLDRIAGVARTPEELDEFLTTVVEAVRDEIAAADDAGITLLDGTKPPRTVSTAPDGRLAETYGSLLAVPLLSAGETLGSLDLYATAADAFDDTDAAVVRIAAQVCADTVAAAQEIIGARLLAAQLEQAMGSRAVIEQAKGILIGLRGTSANEAFEILRKESQDRNIRLRDLAENIVTTAQGALAGGNRRA